MQPLPLATPGTQLSFDQMCTWETFSSLADVLFSGILSCAVESVILPDAVAVARYSNKQKVHMAYTRDSTTSGSKSVIHYLLSAHAQFKNDRENWSGQNRTSWTACYGHATHLFFVNEHANSACVYLFLTNGCDVQPCYS